MSLTLLCLALVLPKQCKRDVINSLISSCRVIFKYACDLLSPFPAIKALVIHDNPSLNPLSTVCRDPLRI